MLIHTSNKKINVKKLIRREQWNTFKPYGLWYATNKEWIEFAKKILDRSYKYIYLIKLHYTTLDEPDKDKVLKITNKDEVINFTLKYGLISKGFIGKMEYSDIDWKFVEREFGGLDVTELFLKEARVTSYERFSYVIESKYYDIKWLDVWDVPSGCVWNPKAIKQLKLI